MMITGKLSIIGNKILTKHLVGSSIQLPVSPEFDSSNNQEILNLWQHFMTNNYHKLLPYCIDENIIAVEEPITRHHISKWATVEIAHDAMFTPQIDGLNTITIDGVYFGFIHTGTALQFNQVYQQAIDYLTNNHIRIDHHRPRLEMMHRDYLPDNPLSKEEFWIPIFS